MALPRETDPYKSYTEQLVYFSARLAANPSTASLADVVELLLAEVDAAQEKLRLARRDEIRARAQRDHQDGIGDAQVRRFKRSVDVIGDSTLTSRLFPNGVAHATAPRGRPQLERLAKLALAIDEYAASPRAAAHAEADDIEEILTKGKAVIADLSDKLTPIIDGWEAETLEVARAVDAFAFVRSDGIGRLGAVLGELRAKLGGNSKAAYGYTQQGRTGAAVEDEGEGEGEGEASEASEG